MTVQHSARLSHSILPVAPMVSSALVFKYLNKISRFLEPIFTKMLILPALLIVITVNYPLWPDTAPPPPNLEPWTSLQYEKYTDLRPQSIGKQHLSGTKIKKKKLFLQGIWNKNRKSYKNSTNQALEKLSIFRVCDYSSHCDIFLLNSLKRLPSPKPLLIEIHVWISPPALAYHNQPSLSISAPP